MAFRRKHSVRISVGIHAYRRSINPRDYDPLKTFLSSEIGERLQIRERTF